VKRGDAGQTGGKRAGAQDARQTQPNFCVVTSKKRDQDEWCFLKLKGGKKLINIGQVRILRLNEDERLAQEILRVFAERRKDSPLAKSTGS